MALAIQSGSPPAASPPTDAGLPPVVTDAAPAPDQAKPAEPTPVTPRKLQVPFPVSQYRKGQSGYVIVQFRLDPEGMPKDLAVVRAEPQNAFEAAVLRGLRKVRFSVSPEWAAANPERRLQMGYVFSIGRCVNQDILPGITTIIIVASLPNTPLPKCFQAPPAAEPAPA